MREGSQRIFVQATEDSKISLHKLTGSEDYVLMIQDFDSADVTIVGKEENEFKLEKGSEGYLTNPVLIGNVEKRTAPGIGYYPN